MHYCYIYPAVCSHVLCIWHKVCIDIFVWFVYTENRCLWVAPTGGALFQLFRIPKWFEKKPIICLVGMYGVCDAVSVFRPTSLSGRAMTQFPFQLTDAYASKCLCFVLDWYSTVLNSTRPKLGEQMLSLFPCNHLIISTYHRTLLKRLALKKKACPLEYPAVGSQRISPKYICRWREKVKQASTYQSMVFSSHLVVLLNSRHVNFSSFVMNTQSTQWSKTSGICNCIRGDGSPTTNCE